MALRSAIPAAYRTRHWSPCCHLCGSNRPAAPNAPNAVKWSVGSVFWRAHGQTEQPGRAATRSAHWSASTKSQTQLIASFPQPMPVGAGSRTRAEQRLIITAAALYAACQIRDGGLPPFAWPTSRYPDIVSADGPSSKKQRLTQIRARGEISLH